MGCGASSEAEFSGEAPAGVAEDASREERLRTEGEEGETVGVEEGAEVPGAETGGEEFADGTSAGVEAAEAEDTLLATARFFEELEEELALVESALGSADPGTHPAAAEAALLALEALGSPRRREARLRFGDWSLEDMPGVDVSAGQEALAQWGWATAGMDAGEVDALEACLSRLHVARMEVGVDGLGIRDLGRLSRPPPMVQFTLDTVCLCLGQQNTRPRRNFDPMAFAERNKLPLKSAGPWRDIRRRVNAPANAFRDEVTGADLLSLRLIDAGVLAKVRKRLKDPGFAVEIVQHATSSRALAGLRAWISAIIDAHDASMRLDGVQLGACIDVSRHPLAMHRIAQKCAEASPNPSPLLETKNFRWMASLMAINRRVAHAKDVEVDDDD